MGQARQKRLSGVLAAGYAKNTCPSLERLKDADPTLVSMIRLAHERLNAARAAKHEGPVTLEQFFVGGIVRRGLALFESLEQAATKEERLVVDPSELPPPRPAAPLPTRRRFMPVPG